MYELPEQAWVYYLTGAGSLLLSLATTGHAIIYKRDSRAAVGWVGLIWFAPILGPIFYLLLGINRVRRRASRIRRAENELLPNLDDSVCPPAMLAEHLSGDATHLMEMAHLIERLTQLPLLQGNRINALQNGDEAYPAMLTAIRNAQASITLTSYIFDNDRIGLQFAEALADAVRRGVEVRVLIDAVGARYSLPPITHRLRSLGVRTARFMPSYLPWTTPYFNLRSHRKILVIDGQHGFTGGMNIRAGNMLADRDPHPIRDTHFEVHGPVIQELQTIFAEDWYFTTGEILQEEPWFTPIEPCGNVMARVIADGPDKNYDKMRSAFQGALSVAKQHVKVLTPYFLPDAALIGALNTCALRGVQVDIVLPKENNLKMVAWASMAQMWQVLEWGCQVWMTPLPFDHSKLLVVDDHLSIIGSSNWDPRSLRLNFEVGLECYDAQLSDELSQMIDDRIRVADPLTLNQVNSRRLPVKLRDGVARLFAPYL